MQINTLVDIENFLKTRIPPRSTAFPGDFGLKRTKHLLKLLGNPQNKIKVIHIAGTSGKGSTSTLTSQLLMSQGFKVGLHLSPHIYDIRERFQINNQLPKEELVVKYFKQILPAINQTALSNFGPPTYFEIIVGLSFYMFFQEGLDYAVIETGLGGLFDATNCVSNKNKIVILTKIGLDHTHILGKHISDIAFQKASIITSCNSVIHIQQHPSAQKVIEKIANKNKATLFPIKPNKDFVLHDQSPAGIIFDANIQQNFKKIKLGLGGIYQAENCTLALSCLLLCAKRQKVKIKEDSLREALYNITFIGRMQQMNIGNHDVILDGAHNPQKMSSFTKSLSKIYPDKKFSFLVAFKKDKDYKQMLKKIIPIAKNITITNFYSSQENYPTSADTSEIANFLKTQDFLNYSIIDNSEKNIINEVRKNKGIFIITGSFYLIASIYSYLLFSKTIFNFSKTEGGNGFPNSPSSTHSK